jgi:effector-binding domain-containing protein
VKMPSTFLRFAAAGLLAILAAGAGPAPGWADDAPSTVQSAPAAAPAAQPPSTSAPGEAPQPPAASDAANPGDSGKAKAEGSTGETVVLAPRPFAFIEGKADRDEVYGAIQGSLGLVKRDIDKAGLKPAGRPLAVFVESDDTGFRYHAGYPLEAAPAGKTNLSEAVKIAVTPSGKAMRFQHLGAYADIDATYDAITAYLDEKGIDAQDSFIEEYVNDVKDGDDPNLEVDIFVLLK